MLFNRSTPDRSGALEIRDIIHPHLRLVASIRISHIRVRAKMVRESIRQEILLSVKHGFLAFTLRSHLYTDVCILVFLYHRSYYMGTRHAVSCYSSIRWRGAWQSHLSPTIEILSIRSSNDALAGPGATSPGSPASRTCDGPPWTWPDTFRSPRCACHTQIGGAAVPCTRSCCC